MTTRLISKKSITQWVITTFLLCIIFQANSQNKSHNSNQKVNQLIEQAEQSESNDEILKLCTEVQTILQTEPDPVFKFDSYKKAGVLLYDSKFSNKAKVFLSEAYKYKDKASNKEDVAIVENYLGWIESDNHKYSKAINHFQEAIKIYKNLKLPEKLGNAYNSLGAMHWYLRNYAQALEQFDHVLMIGEETDNTTLIKKALTNKGVVLNTLAQYNEALICLERALELNQLENDPLSRATLLINIGNINKELRNNKLALENYQQALVIYTNHSNKEGISTCYNNLGEIYLELGNIFKAIENYQTSLSISKEEGDSTSIAVSYVNIGRAHQSGKQYSKAILYFEKALKLMFSFDDPSLKAETYLHLGQTLTINKHYKPAFDYLEKASKLASSLDEKVLLADTYNSLSDWYKLQGDYQEALNYKTKYADLNESIMDEQAMLSSARMEAVYKLLHKEEQISILEQDNIDKSESLAMARNSRTIYLAVAGALLIGIIVLFISFRMRRKAERMLTLKNNELKQLNQTKDKFFSIIAHDLKSPFSSLMGFAEMLALNAESKNTKEVIEYSQIIHNSTKRLLGLVENLLQWSRTQIGTTEYKPSQLDISIQTHNIVSLLRLNAEEKDIIISPKIERNLVAWADENLYNTVLRNLISNAIKFSRVGSMINVTAGVKNNMIEVSVADSGVGIRQENLEKLFLVDSNFSTKGTLNEKGTGLGLVLCKEFVEINKGNIWAESQLERGSTFYFTLPLLNGNNTD